jgi:hypothetical protein
VTKERALRRQQYLASTFGYFSGVQRQTDGEYELYIPPPSWVYASSAGAPSKIVEEPVFYVDSDGNEEPLVFEDPL